jgi:uncharacterized protein
MALAMMFLVCSLAMAHGEVNVDDTGLYIVDTAQVMDGKTANELEGWLRALETQTTAQVKVLTVPTTDGEDIFAFSQRQFEHWKLGIKSKDNGALIVLAVAEHKLRIHTGRGLEGAMPDSWCGTLSRKIVADYFKRGAFAEGLREITLTVLQKVATEYGVTITDAQPAHAIAQQHATTLSPLSLLIVVLVVLFLIYAYRRGWIRSDGAYAPIGGMGGGFPSGGWSSGGGWSGGGDWGGGGGSFGGGGDSGGGGGGASW